MLIRKLLPLLLFVFPIIGMAQMTPTYIVDIPTRDTMSIAADVYVPNGCVNCPTILIQTPYNKNSFRWGLPMGTGMDLQSSQYSWVVTDWRGFYGSMSSASPDATNGEDGYDVIDWIVAQPWSNGKVGTWGPSALGKVQYETIKEHHPNHTCAAPLVAHPEQGYDGYFYGGVLESARLASLDFLGFGVSPLVLANPYYNIIWQVAEFLTWYPEEIDIPTLQIGGWYDHNIDIMMDWYEATRTNADISVQDEQWLLVGPWVHGGTGPAYVGTSIQGELAYPNAEFVSDTMALKFFDYYLLNANNDWENTPLITFYEMGLDQWNGSMDASIEDPVQSALLLGPNGMLGGSNPSGSSSFLCDPSNPSPTIGGQTLSQDLDQGPYDQISLQSRTDVLSFETEVLLDPVQISGRVKADLVLECDQEDADLVVRLVDVYPDGRNMLINDGIHRMRFRNGYTQGDEAFMIPGQAYNIEVSLPFTNYTWETGHKIKAYISGNSASRWDVNLQNGDSMYVAGDTNIANITIHHGAMGLSKMTFPGPTGTVSIQEGITGPTLHVFPNPVQNTLSIEVSGTPTHFEVLDLAGRIQMSGKFQRRLDVSAIPKGIHILYIRTEDNSFRKKFVKL